MDSRDSITAEHNYHIYVRIQKRNKDTFSIDIYVYKLIY